MKKLDGTKIIFKTLVLAGLAFAASAKAAYPSSGALITTLGTISDSSVTSGNAADYSISLTSNPTLAAGTRYWIGLSDTSGLQSWSWSDDISGPGVAGEYFENGNGVFPNTDGPYQMDLAGSSGVIYDNLGAASSGADPIQGFAPLADSFTAPTTETLTSLSVELYGASLEDAVIGGPQATTGTITVNLYASTVPDAGSTVSILGLGFASLVALRRKLA